MSALKHGFFQSGFMLCDRCASNVDCGRFQPKGRCALEKEAFEKLVSELMSEFEMESVVDRILVERAAMYLIRIARAEAYESVVGVTPSSALWGSYISRLDNTLRNLLNDLALTRLKRKRFEKDEEFLVSLDELMRKFVKAGASRRKRPKAELEQQRVYFLQRKAMWISWKKEYRQLRLTMRRGRDSG